MSNFIKLYRYLWYSARLLSKCTLSYTQECAVQTLSHAQYVGHRPCRAHLTVSNTNTHTECKPCVIVQSNYYSSLGSHLLSSLTPLSLFLSVAMPIDSVIYYCLTTLSSCLHILIAICTSSIHHFSSSFTHHFTHSLYVFLSFKSQRCTRWAEDYILGAVE